MLTFFRFLFLFAASTLLTPVGAQGGCSATVPCSVGCCGKNGDCGLGPDFCSPDNCINSCDARAECDPGSWGPQYVKNTSCPLNACCSKFGYCGTTEEFCSDNIVKRPSCDVASQPITRVIGYYGSGAATRACNGMEPAGIPQGVYSHIYFGFASINPSTLKVEPSTQADLAAWSKLQELKVGEPNLQLWLSIGGWAFSDPGAATATTFSDLAAADITRQNDFFASLNDLLKTYGFTGVDIDWEYPGAPDRNGREEDSKNFPVFLGNLKSALSENQFGLSITLPTSYWYLQYFDLPAIEPHVDWFNYMSYDLHSAQDTNSKRTGAQLGAHTNLTEIETALDLLWRDNIDPSKVVLGLAFYGRSFTLSSDTCNTPGCVYVSGGDKGACSEQTGLLLNSEIGSIVREHGITPTLYSSAAVKVATWDNQWVSYDDQDTFKLKGDFAKSQCLGGVMVWAVDYDNTQGNYSYGLADALGNKISVSKAAATKRSVGPRQTAGVLTGGPPVRPPSRPRRWLTL